MNKNEYNKLSILEQLKYINSQLKKGDSLRAISGNLGLSKTTIRDRFTKLGYTFNAEQRQYLQTTNETVAITQTKHNANIAVKTQEKEIIEQHTTNTSMFNSEDVLALKELLMLKNDLVSLVNSVKHKDNIIELPEVNIDSKRLTGDVKTRSFNLYEDVLNAFGEFCKKNKQYTQKDLLSMAMLEYIDKHKK